MSRTFTPEELTPTRLAIEWDVWKRAEAEAIKARGDISRARTRLHEMENHLAKMEQDHAEAADFLSAYFMTHGPG